MHAGGENADKYRASVAPASIESFRLEKTFKIIDSNP